MNPDKFLSSASLVGPKGNDPEYLGVIVGDLGTLAKRATGTEHGLTLLEAERLVGEKRARLARKIIAAARARNESAMSDLLFDDARLEGLAMGFGAARRLPTILQKKAQVRLRKLDNGGS